MLRFGIMADYDYSDTHKRERLTIWTGMFASIYVGEAYSLPRGDGYMIAVEDGPRVRVACPTPRDDNTYEAVDSAINAALYAAGVVIA